MNTIKFAILFLCLSFLFIHCSAQNNENAPDDINKVRKEQPGEMIMMGARATETGQISDYIWFVASSKGENNGLLIKHPSSTAWRELESDIQLFKYEEGFEYEIMIAEESFIDTTQAPIYTLTRVFEKKKKKSDIRKASEQGVFENTTWYMAAYDGEKVEEGYIQFRGKNIGASMGCNGLSGMGFQANQNKKTLRFVSSDRAMMTTKACSDSAMMSRESRLFEMLDAVTNYDATEDKLTLKNKDKVLMVLKR